MRNERGEEILPEGYKMTELGPLPEEWRVVRLGEVLERSFSGVWGEEPTVATKDDQYTIVRVIRVSDVEPNSQIAYAKVPFRAVRRRDAERCRLKPTDILVVKSSGSKTKVISGRSAIFEKDSDNVYIPANFLLALRPSKVLSEAHFVWYYLLTPKAKQWVEHVVEGSTYPNLNKAEYLAMPIPLPPLPEQRAIAHVLRTVQRAKEATEGVIAALKELKKSLMQHLFTYGPVPVTERERVALQESEIGPSRALAGGEVGGGVRHSTR
jgi:type I restriction enzyme S subunit